MFYRVDYTLAILLTGFFIGLLISRKTAGIARSRLANTYYAITAALLILRIVAFACTVIASQPGFWSKASGIVGDLLGLLFGLLFGLAMRRADARTFLTERSILQALCMTLAFTFGLAGIGKAFSMAPMTEFFTQSGYSVAFLKFIAIAEIFGGLSLLLPWAVLLATAALSIDMFGAVLTHIHNGDPLNDSTGAIGLLIRLACLGILWSLRPRKDGFLPTVRNSIVGVAAVAVACFALSLGGSITMRHLNTAQSTPSTPTSK